jgi:deazaflavin-dependent oxidoreductase (nitroreductase family)
VSKTLYAVINPVVKFILRSPLHGLMSRNTVLLEFKGRKSGKTYTTPVSYRAAGDHVYCFTDKANKWWHNLRHGDKVALTLRGRRLVGKPTVLADGSAPVRAALRDLLIASPRDASHAGVKFDADGQPVASDVAEASKRLVFISIEVPD